MKIGFFQTAFLGDLLLAVPSLFRIRQWKPNAEITVFCRKGLGSLMEKLPCVDVAIEVDKKDPQSRQEFSRKIETLSFDILFCPHQSARTHFWVRRIKCKRKIGFSRWWNRFFFDVRVSRPVFLPDPLRQMSLLAPVIPNVERFLKPYLEGEQAVHSIPPEASMTLTRKFWEASGLEALNLPKKKYVCLAPGSVWNTKRWTFTGFEETAKHFKGKGFEIFFMGSPAEATLCERLAAEVGGTSMAGKLSLWQVAQFLSQADLMISNDSGGQHLASLAGVPTVSVFGPTVLELGYQPWQDKAAVVQENLPCRPCGKHGHMSCPLGTHDCMKKIPAQRVIGAGVSLLKESEL